VDLGAPGWGKTVAEEPYKSFNPEGPVVRILPWQTSGVNVREYSLVGLHGIELVKRCVKSDVQHYGNVREVSVSEVTEEKTREKDKEIVSEQRITVDATYGAEGSRPAATFVLYDGGLDCTLDNAGAKRLCELIGYCIVELKPNKGKQRKYVCLQVPKDREFLFQDGGSGIRVASVGLQNLPAEMVTSSDFHVGDVGVGVRGLTREPLFLKLDFVNNEASEGAYCLKWQYPDPWKLDLAKLELELKRDHEKELHFELHIASADFARIVQNYHGTWLAWQCLNDLKGNPVLDKRTRHLEILEKLKSMTPLLALGVVNIATLKARDRQIGDAQDDDKKKTAWVDFRTAVKEGSGILEEQKNDYENYLVSQIKSRAKKIAEISETEDYDQLMRRIRLPEEIWKGPLEERTPLRESESGKLLETYGELPEADQGFLRRLLDRYEFEWDQQEDPKLTERFAAMCVELYHIVPADDTSVHVPLFVFPKPESAEETETKPSSLLER
jgi:hypothetical protein